jgi:dTDP-4-amino-4,6-dideoxygalactose transaminase
VSVPFLDLRRQSREDAEAALARVLDRGLYILSEEVAQFEAAFADYCGTRHAVGVASGTDAITVALLAAGIGPGDEVITAPNTCVPTLVGIERAGARPVLADVDPTTYTLDPFEVERRLTPRTRAIVPVHLYGQTADMGLLLELARAHDLLVVEDCAQAHGAKHAGRRAGSLGAAGAFSFYPTKNLGCLGDGGAITTDDDEIAAQARLLRSYGERERFNHVLRGLNSRLDEFQAAVLTLRLGSLDAGNGRRRELAATYTAALEGSAVVCPAEGSLNRHVYHLYVLQVESRDPVRSLLAERGIGTGVHYPLPMHRQPAYVDLDVPGGFPVAEALCSRVLSLPLSPEHTDEEIAVAAAAVAEVSAAFGEGAGIP